MIPWKHRIYAFLLRRALGPILDAESLRQLHSLLDVSITDGRCTLRNVSFRREFLREKLAALPLRVRKARVRELTVHLTFQEDDETNPAAWSTLASEWGKALPRIALAVKLELEGVWIELEPQIPVASSSPNTAATETTPGLLSLYLDAALKSMDLSAEIRDITIRCWENSEDEEGAKQQAWVELRCQSLSYQTAALGTSSDLTYVTTLHKTIALQKASVVIGENEQREKSESEMERFRSSVALLEGVNRITLRVIEYTPPTGDSVSAGSETRAETDCEINLSQKLNISFDATSVLHLRKFAETYSSHFARQVEPREVESPATVDVESDYETEDVDFLNTMMEQYREARQQVERNELRGGVLVPDFTENKDAVTFDMFFDANDKSFYHYSALLHDSVTMSPNGTQQHPGVALARMRFHVKDVGVKVVFSNDGDVASRRGDNYVLISVSGIDFSSNIFSNTQEHALAIDRFEIEESFVSISEEHSLISRKVEIRPILSFLYGSDSKSDDVLVQPPCISLNLRKNKTGGLDFDLELLPLVYECQLHTLARVSRFAADVQSYEPLQPKGEIDIVKREVEDGPMRISLTCPGLHFELPVMKEGDWESAFERSVYEVASLSAKKVYFGIDIENIAIAVNRKQEECDEDLSLSFDNAVAFVSFPNSARSIDHISRRFDIFSIAGRAEVQPTIPVNIKLWQDCLKEGEQKSPLRGQVEFPEVTPISSFKARQDDEDDDARIDRVLCSKLGGVEPPSRSRLRQVDAQQGRIQNAAKSNIVIAIEIPEVVGDLTSAELSSILSMVQCISTREPSSASSSSTEKRKSREGLHFASLLVSVTSTTLAVHDDAIADECIRRSFAIKGHALKIHGVVCGNDLIQGRLLLQDVNFFEVENSSKQRVNDSDFCKRDRVYSLRRRLALSKESLTRPIFHRSKLFKPISPTSPCVLLDFSIPDRADSPDDLVETHVQLTLYDITMRFDYESRDWPIKLRSVFVPAGDTPAETSRDELAQLSSTFFARIGVSLADCNVDYLSPLKFKTASRVIFRLGDLRFSTNMLLPQGPSQSFSVTLGDISVYLCNSRFPYNFENSCLLGSTTIFQPWQRSVNTWQSHVNAEISSDDIQRKMNFRTLVTLSSLDAVICLSKSPRNTEAFTSVGLTLGELALFCCKDSFSVFLSTIGEVSCELSAVDDAALQALKAISAPRGEELFFDSFTEDHVDDNDIRKTSAPTLAFLKQQSALRPQFGTDSNNDRSRDFLLDGYDWTTIDSDEISDNIPAGEEQSARWFTAPKLEKDERTVIRQGYSTEMKRPAIFNHHFRLQPVSDPLGEGDMGASKYSGNSSKCQVKSRILMHDFNVKVRCFDGYDWPEMLDESLRSNVTSSPFVIGSIKPRDRNNVQQEMSTGFSKDLNSKSDCGIAKIETETKSKLMNALLDDNGNTSTIFSDLPLPEDRNKFLRDQSEIRRLSRRTSKYIQLSASGIQLRLDSFEESTDHRLASCLDMKISDFFVAETISKDRPTKMAGEWVNDEEHPRNTKDGLAAIKMVSWHRAIRVTPENEIVSDEAEFALKLLPLRCSLDQRAIRFALAFFSTADNNDADKANEPLPEGLHSVPPPLFTSFRVRPLKIKVDYKPEKIDTDALKNGAVVELVNLSPLDGMVVTLQEVVINNEIGFGPNIGILLKQWIQDVVATQLHKFVTHAAPFQPITHVGGSAIDLVVLPWEALQNGESIRRAFRAGTTSFTNAVSYETFTLSSRMTEFFASTVASLTSPRHALLNTGGFSSTLPSRPIHIPRTLNDASQHALESLSRGMQAANYRIVIVPYREYHRTGAAGAGSSFIRGIPVAIAAPASGVAEAISFSLLAIRNQLRPDILREEEASLRGLLLDDERKDNIRH